MYVLEFAGQDDAFAAAEAGNAATAVESIAPGLATAASIEPERLRGLAYTRRASRLLGRTDPTVDRAAALVQSAPLDRAGTAAVRARDVRGTTGVDTERIEAELGSLLVERGFEIDLEAPANELRVLCSDGVCAVGWLAAESRRDYGARRPSAKPFFQPGSMDPLDARAIANLAGAAPGRRILDPMCGTGGVLVEAGLLGAWVLGIDAQSKMVAGARRNLARYLDAPVAVARGDAARLPVREGRLDAAVFDVPYGRQSPVAGRDLASTIAAALAEARRVAPRAVVVGDRSLDGAAEAAGWRVDAEFDRPVHRSLTRHVHVLEADDP